MARILPYFRPPYPAIKRFCQLCQTEVGTDQYETQEVRDIEARAKGGQYVFCLRCSERVGEVAALVEAERARLQADFEQSTEKTIQGIVRQALADAPSRAAEQRSSSPTSGANEAARIPPVRRRGTQIPNGAASA